MNKDTKCTAITFSFCMLKKSHRISTNIPGEITRTMNASVAFSDSEVRHQIPTRPWKESHEKRWRKRRKKRSVRNYNTALTFRIFNNININNSIKFYPPFQDFTSGLIYLKIFHTRFFTSFWQIHSFIHSFTSS